LLVVLVARLDERPYGDRAGVGHDDLEAALALRFVEQAPHLLQAAYVRLQRSRPPTRSLDRRYDFTRPVRAPRVIDDHLRAVARQSFRNRTADAARAAGHDRDLPSQACHSPPPG